MKQPLTWSSDAQSSSVSPSCIAPPAGRGRPIRVIRSVPDLRRFHLPFKLVQRNARRAPAVDRLGCQRGIPPIPPSAICNRFLRLFGKQSRSEEHTSELQSRQYL